MSARFSSSRPARVRSASQSAAVSRPASAVSASRPTTGTTSHTARRRIWDWSAAIGPATGHGSWPGPGASLSALLYRAREFIGELDSCWEALAKASSASTSSARTCWVNT